MKKIFKRISLFALIVFLFAGSGLAVSAAEGNSYDVSATASGSITILDDFKYLQEGAQFRIACNNTSKNETTWSSSNNSIATVDSKGYLTCVGTGTVTITADIGHAKSSITFTVGNYANIFRTEYTEVTINVGSCAYIELAGTKADFFKAAVTGNTVQANNGAVYFYNESVRIAGLQKGTSYVTVFNTSGYACTMKVNVIGARDASGLSGVQYDAEGSRQLFDDINRYRKSLGLAPCEYSADAESTALAQIITAHRMRAKDERYDCTLHNQSQLSFYEFYYIDYQGAFPVDEMLDAWKASPGHNRALTMADYNRMGVSVCKTPYGTCAFMFIGTEKMLDWMVSGDISSDGPSLPLLTTKPVNSSISAKDITKTYGSSSFRINAKASAPLTYKSSNTSVVTVSKNTGLVKIKGCGKATITISGRKLKTKKITITIKPKKQSVKLKKTGKRSFKAILKKDTKASGYQIVYSKRPDFKSRKTVNVKGYKKYAKTISRLTSKKYYVKARSYKDGTLNGKRYTVYGSYSSARAIRLR